MSCTLLRPLDPPTTLPPNKCLSLLPPLCHLRALVVRICFVLIAPLCSSVPGTLLYMLNGSMIEIGRSKNTNENRKKPIQKSKPFLLSVVWPPSILLFLCFSQQTFFFALSLCPQHEALRTKVKEARFLPYRNFKIRGTKQLSPSCIFGGNMVRLGRSLKEEAGLGVLTSHFPSR